MLREEDCERGRGCLYSGSSSKQVSVASVSYSCRVSFSFPEQCVKHNAVKERIQKDFEIKTDFLKRHLKKLEEERTNEVQELSRSNEMRIRQVVR